MSEVFVKRLTFTPLYRLLERARAKQQLQLFIDLQTMLHESRAGREYNVAGALRPILDTNGNTSPANIYGMQIPLEIRMRWRRVGIDIDSDNEVFELLARYNPRMSEQFDVNDRPSIKNRMTFG